MQFDVNDHLKVGMSLRFQFNYCSTGRKTINVRLVDENMGQAKKEKERSLSIQVIFRSFGGSHRAPNYENLCLTVSDSVTVSKLSSLIKSKRPSLQSFRLMNRTKSMHCPDATMQDYQIRHNQVITCAVLQFTLEVSDHEKKMLEANAIIIKLSGAVRCLNRRFSEMKSQIEGVSSLPALQQVSSKLILEMNHKISECRKPDEINQIKNSLIHSNHNVYVCIYVGTHLVNLIGCMLSHIRIIHELCGREYTIDLTQLIF